MRNPQPQASDGRNRCGSPYDPDQARGAPVRGLGAASEGGHTEPDRAQRTAGITDQVVGRHAAHGNTDQRRPSSRCTARFSPWHFQRRRAGRVRRGRKRMVADGAPPIRSRVITMRMTSSAPGLTLYAHGRCQGAAPRARGTSRSGATRLWSAAEAWRRPQRLRSRWQVNAGLAVECGFPCGWRRAQFRDRYRCARRGQGPFGVCRPGVARPRPVGQNLCGRSPGDVSPAVPATARPAVTQCQRVPGPDRRRAVLSWSAHHLPPGAEALPAHVGAGTANVLWRRRAARGGLYRLCPARAGKQCAVWLSALPGRSTG